LRLSRDVGQRHIFARSACSTKVRRRSNLDRLRAHEVKTMICLAQCLGSFLLGAILASIATSLLLEARQDLDGKNRPGA
jgi:hypothetical protein